MPSSHVDGGCGPTCCAFWDRRRHALVSAVLRFFSSMHGNCEWGHACVMCEPPGSVLSVARRSDRCCGVWYCNIDEPGGEIHTRGRTDTDDDDWYSAEKHAWAASAEERATCARVPAMRGMRQSPQTPLGGPAVAASTQSDQRRSAGASFPRARHQRPCLAYTSNALRGGCRTARRDGLNRIARAGISRAILGKSSLSSRTAWR